MMKEIGWRRLKEDVKALEAWKSKAKTLEDCVLKQNSIIGMHVCMYVCMYDLFLFLFLRSTYVIGCLHVYYYVLHRIVRKTYICAATLT